MCTMEMNIKLSLGRLGKTLRGGQPRLDGKAASAKRSEAAGQKDADLLPFTVSSLNTRLAGFSAWAASAKRSEAAGQRIPYP